MIPLTDFSPLLSCKPQREKSKAEGRSLLLSVSISIFSSLKSSLASREIGIREEFRLQGKSMGYDAMANNASVPVISRDFGKKKKANRSAKLKQCKLDARREQWLSQVKNKGGNDGITGPSLTSPSSHPTVSVPKPGQGVLENRPRKREPLVEMEQDGSGIQDSGLDSPVEGLTQGVNMQRKDYSSTSGSSGSSVGSCSRSISDAEEDRQEEENIDDKGGVDDWEAVADALSDISGRTNSDSVKTVVDSKTYQVHQMDTRVVFGPQKPEANRAIHRAWRPDDVARPQCLPTLSKQRSFPVNMERRFSTSGWGHKIIVSTPSSCPICVEDFDITDSSFLPCFCGFRICLFCHKKILEEGDGRCPGCRKKYDQVASMESIITGADLSFPCRFSRSCSMRSRS